MTQEPLSEQQAVQLRRRTRVVLTAAGVALVITLVIAVLVLVQVPWDTFVQSGRASRPITAPVFIVLGIPVVLAITLWMNRRPPTKPIPAFELGFWAVVFLACVVGQLVFARSFFEAAAATAQ